MKNNNIKNKTIIIALLFAFMTVIFLQNQIDTNVLAEEYTPEEHENNAWRWKIETDTLLAYNTEVLYESNESVFANRALEIWNITAIKNQTNDVDFGEINLYSDVIAEPLYYNVSAGVGNEFQQYMDGGSAANITLSSFNYNSSRTGGEYDGYEASLLWLDQAYYGLGGEGDGEGFLQLVPLVVPINSSTEAFTADDLGFVLNKTYFAYAYHVGIFNFFDDYTVQESTNSINFVNTTTDYFLNLTYHDNGTLFEAKGKMGLIFGEGETANMTFSYEHTTQYNILTDIEWGMEIGDQLHYGRNNYQDFGNYLTDTSVTGIWDDRLTVQGIHSDNETWVDAAIVWWDEFDNEYYLEIIEITQNYAGDVEDAGNFTIVVDDPEGYLGVNLTIGDSIDINEYQVSEYYESMIEVVDISQELLPINYFGINEFLQPFEVVSVNVSLWNWTLESYELMPMEPTAVGIANDLLPINFFEIMGGEPELSERLGASVQENVQVAEVWENNITVLDGASYGVDYNNWYDCVAVFPATQPEDPDYYFRISYIKDNWAGDQEDTGNFTLVFDEQDIDGDIRGRISPGQSFDIYELEESSGDEGGLFFFPKTVQQDDIEFFFNNDTAPMFEAESIEHIDEGELNILSSQGTMSIRFNLDTGLLINSNSYDAEGELVTTVFRKNDTVLSPGYTNYDLWAQRDDTVEVSIEVSNSGTDDVALYTALLDHNPTFGEFQGEVPGMPIYFDIYTNDSTAVQYFNLTVVYDPSLLEAANIVPDALTVFGFGYDNETWNEDRTGNIEIIIDEGTNSLTVNNVPLTIPMEDDPLNYFAIGYTGIPWSFAVNVGDMIVIEDEGTINYLDGGEQINWELVDVDVYEVIGKTWVIYEGQEYQNLTLQSVYYNTSTQDFESLGYSTSLLIGYNETNEPHNRMIFDIEGGLPYPPVLPLQYKSLNMSLIADILLETQPYSSMWDTIVGYDDNILWSLPTLQHRMHMRFSRITTTE